MQNQMDETSVKLFMSMSINSNQQGVVWFSLALKANKMFWSSLIVSSKILHIISAFFHQPDWMRAVCPNIRLH